jgi:tryptophan 2,3-dioxygenase
VSDYDRFCVDDDRADRIEEYFDDCLASELAEKLVDAEDELEVWKAKVIKLERLLAEAVRRG